MTVKLYHGDCLDIMPTLMAGSVDAIITDLPYGTTACEWDSIIPLDEMWKQVKRVLKPSGVFVTTASQPFTSALVMSNPKWFRYEWIWQKHKGGNFQSTKYVPFKVHENVCVFYKKMPTYNPQLEKRTESGLNRLKYKIPSERGVNPVTGLNVVTGERNELRAPTSVKKFNGEAGSHPTQNPVELYEYLIRTYTNAGETVLDICMGSGTTGVAAIQTGRNFIGIEKEKKYFEIASRRIAQAPQPLFTEPPRQPTQREPDLELESGKLSGFE